MTSSKEWLKVYKSLSKACAFLGFSLWDISQAGGGTVTQASRLWALVYEVAWRSAELLTHPQSEPVHSLMRTSQELQIRL